MGLVLQQERVEVQYDRTCEELCEDVISGSHAKGTLVLEKFL
jgi:hypothetical protein